MKEMTRAEYMAGTTPEKHQVYMVQFYNEKARAALLRAIPLEKIKASKDAHFNDIALKKWGSLPFCFDKDKIKRLGDSPTLAFQVCAYKAIARKICQENGWG